MNYRFIVDYTPTDPAGVSSRRVCSPIYSDDLSVNIEMESDEWYRKRKLEGKLTFMRDDYRWIMGCAFDGTFTMTVQGNSGGSWVDYFVGTFSRANLEIDEDNKNAVLNGLNEGGEYNAIENGKSEEYDLMKIIPDADAKEVQGEVHPALAMVDYVSTIIDHSDIFCDAAITAAGYDSKHADSGYNVDERVESDDSWLFRGVYACGEIKDDKIAALNGRYAGTLYYGEIQIPGYSYFLYGDIYGTNGYRVNIGWINHSPGQHVPAAPTRVARVYDQNNNLVSTKIGRRIMHDGVSPTRLAFGSLQMDVHYIRATLLTQDGGNADNVLDTGDYYKRMAAFNNGDGGLRIVASANTVEQSNGHRLVPGTGEQGAVPQYFAPPDETEHWIPLAEYNWNYGSLWYTIEPSVANGLLDPSKVGSFRWTRCWTLGTCLDRLLRKITNNKVTFDQSEAGSQFLYAAVNPLTQGEPFEYLFTQKSNVMNPGQGNVGESASRCIVRLEWFLEFLRNALNCYWWLEERNGGTYAFRVEHVEWFRRGGSYTGHLGDDPEMFDLTKIKPLRNFPRNGEAAKRLDDQLHKYSYDMSGMTEKYTFSWQGDGGSDAFKGNPMFFKAGWVEKGSSESHEVDNIFADLAWLMLNAGSDTASAQNYEGIFAFSGYLPATTAEPWEENSHSTEGGLVIANDISAANIGVCITVPLNESARLRYRPAAGGAYTDITFAGTGKPMYIHVDVSLSFGGIYLMYSQNAILHRVRTFTGSIYNIPNTANLLSPDPANPTYLQNGPLAWPWLQCEYLHYDVPAQKWGYKYDDLDDLDIHQAWETDGTVKMRKKQEVPMLPLPTKSDEDNLDRGVIGGLKDSQGRLQTGIVKSATINLGTRNAELTLMYDMIG